MPNLFQKEQLSAILRFLKPFATVVVIVLILRYTGLLAGVTSITNSALLKAGIKNFEPDKIEVPAEFNYNFTVKSLDGTTKQISDFKGKVIFLNLWATWCGPCRAEMPGIQKLYDRIDTKDIQFVMLSIDQPGSEKKVHSYIQAQAHTFPVYVSQGLTEQLNVPSIPTTFIIDKEGKIVSTKVGMTNFDTSKFQKYLEELAGQ